MPQKQTGLLVVAIAFLVSALAFYAMAVGGVLFGGPSAMDDLGVYAVTVVLFMFGVGTFLLRKSRLAAKP